MLRFRRERTRSVPRVQLRPPGGARRPSRSRDIGAPSRSPRPEALWRERRYGPAAPPAPHGRRPGPRHARGTGGPAARPRPRFPLPGPSCFSSGLWRQKGVTVALIAGLRMVRAGALPRAVCPAPRCPQDPAPDPFPEADSFLRSSPRRRDPVNFGVSC